MVRVCFCLIVLLCEIGFIIVGVLGVVLARSYHVSVKDGFDLLCGNVPAVVRNGGFVVAYSSLARLISLMPKRMVDELRVLSAANGILRVGVSMLPGGVWSGFLERLVGWCRL